jgi:hypothetical protein
MKAHAEITAKIIDSDGNRWQQLAQPNDRRRLRFTPQRG